MVQNLIITPQAQKDFHQAFSFYEEQFAGLGKEFTRCVDAKTAEIRRNPKQFQVIYKEKVRRALVSRFPFSIYFIDDSDSIKVIAILHQSRNPDKWKSRA